jgi:hypothetical protein
VASSGCSVGCFSPQLVTTHFVAIEIDLAPHQPVEPMRIDEELMAQELDLPLSVGQAQIDELTAQRALPVEREVRGKGRRGGASGRWQASRCW